MCIRDRNGLNQEFYECIRDVMNHPPVQEMKKYPHHCDTNCYQHCLNVAYYNYEICKVLGLDAKAAARAGTVSYTHLDVYKRQVLSRVWRVLVP